jgi:hypothetical protein
MEKKLNEDLRAKVIAKAWKDPAFRKKLLAKPNETLKEMGAPIPDDLKIRVQEDDAQHYTFVLPPAPTNLIDFDEAELKKIAAAAGICPRGSFPFMQRGE